MQTEIRTDINNNQEVGVSSWFAEVLELRQKAAEYKKRAQGTHFSREHLVQLLARQTRCWDDPPSHHKSSSLSALALEAGPGSIEQQYVATTLDSEISSSLSHILKHTIIQF